MKYIYEKYLKQLICVTVVINCIFSIIILSHKYFSKYN